MNSEIQRAQDMLAAMQMQRDNALNAMVMAQAELASRDREIAALRKQIEDAREKPELAEAA
jgi:predicted  nucleic acid-binding Zn-ribbon protein